MKPRHPPPPPEIASNQKDHVTNDKLAYHGYFELGRSENSQPAQMNLICQKEFKGDALASTGVMILNSLH